MMMNEVERKGKKRKDVYRGISRERWTANPDGPMKSRR